MLLIAFFLVNGVVSLRSQSINADEGAYTRYAIRYLKGDPGRHDTRRDNSMMPVIAWNMVPRLVQQAISPGLQKHDEGVSDIMAGRYMSLLVGVAIMVLIWIWGSRLYGARAGLFAAFLFSICPNSLANTIFTSTDIYAVLMLLLVMYLLWRTSAEPTLRHVTLLSVAVALAQVTKQSLSYLYLLLPLMLLIRFIMQGHRPGAIQWRKLIRYGLLFLAIQWLVISVAYYFHHSFMPLGDYTFLSNKFRAVQLSLPASLPVPLPEAYVTGLDQALYYNALGGGIEGQSCFGKVTIMGGSATGEGIWYYYLVTLLFKTPITLLILWLLALVKWRGRSWDGWVLTAPVIFFLLVMSSFYQVQAGVRHIIFLYPFMFLMCASLVSELVSPARKWIMAAGMIFWMFSVGRYWSNYYPYTNELVPDKKLAYTYVGHANLEIHQGYHFARRYLAQHPEVQFAPATPSSGIFLVSLNEYMDIWNTGKYQWISGHPPIDVVAYNWLLVRVP